jgi:hypothetical protein
MCDAASPLTGEADVPKPIILTENDFADHEHLRGHDGFVLVLAHTNLLDEKATAPDDHWWKTATDFLQMALRVAEEFPGVQVALFNSRDHEFMARQLGVLFSYSTFECWAQVFCRGEYAHETAGQYDETADIFRTWLLGILFHSGYRRPQSLDEALIWLAYNLCEHPLIQYDEARWNDATMRTDAVKTMKDHFATLQRQWHLSLQDNPEFA